MPRVGPVRRNVVVRMSEAGIESVKQRAIDEQVVKRSGEPNVSEMLRIMFAFAQRNMPKGWRP